MPPPRRPLPLRPWRPLRTSAFVRWASDGPRDHKRARPDDSAPGGGEAVQSAATEVNAHTSRRLRPLQGAPTASRPGGFASRTSTLRSPSVAPATSKPPADRPPSGTACLVCNQEFDTTSALRHHIGVADHVASWPVAFSTLDEAIRRRELWSQFNAAGWRSPYSRARRKRGGRFCDSCNTPIPDFEACVQHLLSNEQCTKSRAGLATEYACCHCLETFETTEHVRQHIQSSPGCEAHHVKIRTVNPELRHQMRRDGKVAHEMGKEDYASAKVFAQKAKERSSSVAEPLVLEEEHVGSTPGPQDELEDLKMELQRLKEQIKLLQGKIGGEGAGFNNNKMTDSSSTTPSATPSPSLQAVSTSSVLSSRSQDETSHLSAGTISSTSVRNRRYEPKLQAQLQKEKLKALLTEGMVPDDIDTPSSPSHAHLLFPLATNFKTDGQRLVRQLHGEAASKSDSKNLTKDEARNADYLSEENSKPNPPSTPDVDGNNESNNRSLLDELFPEASTYTQPHYTERNPYPKLTLPDAVPLISTYSLKEKLTKREQYMQAFQRSTEKLTALQLLHCSTELTESDFRRIVPGGKHIEGWSRDGDLHKVIPGRDPLSLERLPFYYLVFKNPDAALRYKSNATRLHQLSKLHGPTSVMSALPPSAGVLEDGEDINAALTSYLLTPTTQPLQLNMVMQPYNPALSRLLEQGGYKPIVPAVTPAGKPIHKVLLHIEGYESSPYDVYQLFMQDAGKRGLSWPFLQEHQSIRRLRDIIDMKTRFQAVSTANPRAARSDRQKPSNDPYAAFRGDKEERDQPEIEEQDAKVINQIIMNKVYNRWIVEFSEEEGAKRFARVWHRKVLPMQASVKHRTWRDLEEVRMCNAEYLW